MAEVRDWDTTAANNGGASASGYWQEGMNYSEVNNAARENLAQHARLYADRNGSLDTTGSANAYVLAAAQTLSSLQRGDMFRFEANFSNTGAATLNVDAIGATSIVNPDGSALEANQILSGAVVTVVYDGTNFQLISGEAVLNTKLKVPQREIKTSAENVNNSTTLQTDDKLQGFTIAADTWYRVRAVLHLDSQTSGCGAKFRVNMTQDPQRFAGQMVGVDRVAGIAGDAFSGASGGFYEFTIAASALSETNDMVVTIEGTILGHATLSSDLDLQWAMATAVAGNLTMQPGSYMEVEEITDL